MLFNLQSVASNPHTYILLHDWEGNTEEYSVRGWQYWPDRQYITRELNIPLYCPTQKECYNRIDSNLVGGKWKGRGKGKRKREEKERKKVRARVAGEGRTRAPSFVKMVL